MEKLFQRALRNKYRYSSNRGPLSTEDLWDLDLEGNQGFNLDEVARTIHQDLQTRQGERFVVLEADARNVILEDMLEIVKYVIKVKIEERQESIKRAQNLAKINKLADALERKENEELLELSAEELREKIKELKS